MNSTIKPITYAILGVGIFGINFISYKFLYDNKLPLFGKINILLYVDNNTNIAKTPLTTCLSLSVLKSPGQ
jgi:hypothetical protein